MQRVIILLAVIIAVPVVMWTITTVVRTYFAPPKLPTFQRIAENPDTAAVTPQAAPAAAQAQSPAPSGQMADAGTTASDAHMPLLDIRKPVDVQPATTAPAAAPQIVAVQSAAAKPPVVQPSPAAPPIPAVAAPPPMAAPNAATAATAAPAAAMPSGGAMPNSAPAPVAARTAPADTIAWPNPNSNSPPALGADNDAKTSKAATAAERPAPASSDAASETLPPGKPIAGRIPLPLRRPMVMAMAAGPAVAAEQPPPASSDAASEALPSGEPIAGRVPLPPRRSEVMAMAAMGAIPLPRPRPADAPAAASSTPADAPDTSYDPGMEPGHY
ncbi:MAG TPA: hypothetical protein VMC05_06080 [Xanthobacteraceae bacterium]|nr:hypothetical protein [Xanthobacteraceae bacterium]